MAQSLRQVKIQAPVSMRFGVDKVLCINNLNGCAVKN